VGKRIYGPKWRSKLNFGHILASEKNVNKLNPYAT